MTPEFIAIVTVGVALTGLGPTILQVILKRFDQVDRRFEQVDARFERLEDRMAGLEQRVARLEGVLDGLRESLFVRVSS